MLVAKAAIRVPTEYFVEVLWKFLGVFGTDNKLILFEKMAEVHGNRIRALPTMAECFQGLRHRKLSLGKVWGKSIFSFLLNEQYRFLSEPPTFYRFSSSICNKLAS